MYSVWIVQHKCWKTVSLYCDVYTQYNQTADKTLHPPVPGWTLAPTAWERTVNPLPFSRVEGALRPSVPSIPLAFSRAVQTYGSACP